MIQVERREDGGIRIVLRADLAEAMRTLPERLREVLERPDVSQRVAARLFPKAHDDPAEEAEYRRLVGTDLIKKKLAGLGAFEASLDRLKPRRWRSGSSELFLRPDEVDAWLGFINDMRLLIGTELGIEDETWQSKFDARHPHAADFALLHFLSWLEQLLVEALSRSP